MLSIIDNDKEINSHEPAFEHILIAHGCHPRKNRIVNIFKNRGFAFAMEKAGNHYATRISSNLV